MYVCICAAVSSTTVAAAIEDGARTTADVGARCGAGTVCGKCRHTIRLLLQRAPLDEAGDETGTGGGAAGTTAAAQGTRAGRYRQWSHGTRK
jgi:bacterioferritin-associated ferredoxin